MDINPENKVIQEASIEATATIATTREAIEAIDTIASTDTRQLQ